MLGDIVTGIDGKPVKLQKDLFEVLDDLKPGDKVAVQVLRDARTLELPVILGDRADMEATAGGMVQSD